MSKKSTHQQTPCYQFYFPDMYASMSLCTYKRTGWKHQLWLSPNSGIIGAFYFLCASLIFNILSKTCTLRLSFQTNSILRTPKKLLCFLCVKMSQPNSPRARTEGYFRMPTVQTQHIPQRTCIWRQRKKFFHILPGVHSQELQGVFEVLHTVIIVQVLKFYL